jgi:hypothetical protein
MLKGVDYQLQESRNPGVYSQFNWEISHLVQQSEHYIATEVPQIVDDRP